MELNSNHQYIYEKLDYFLKTNKIPNLLFHGDYGVGKKTILYNFLKKIYTTEKYFNNNVLFVNCSQEKGIKFIRDDLKFFARANLFGNQFKSVILINAEHLTADAQSALRRCIELFTNNTRFFIIVEKECQILKPILSRFCNIYIPKPIIYGKKTNYYNIFNNNICKKEDNKKNKYLEKIIIENKINNINEIIKLSDDLYEKGYSGLDLINYIKNNVKENMEKNILIIYFDKIKNQYRNEKIFIIKILYYIYMRNSSDLENIINI
mgnify:CR=1 FL=1|jgi:DNA polymerase III delta prime subunit